VSGGTLRGSGTLGDLIVSSGGTVFPGNSIGTLTVASYTQESGSALKAEIDPSGQADLIHATGVPGTITINGGAHSR
jgi:uncharacterized protein with beta-barrel porin domain